MRQLTFIHQLSSFLRFSLLGHSAISLNLPRTLVVMLVLFANVLPSKVHAQATITPIDTFSLTTGEQSIVNNWQSDTTILTYYLAKFSRTSSVPGYIDVKIDSSHININATLNRLDFNPNEVMFWYGEVNDTGAHIMFAQKNNLTYGEVLTSDISVQFFSLRGDTLLVVERRRDIPDSCSVSASTSSTINYCDEDEECQAMIDVLVLIDDNANQWLEDRFINPFLQNLYLGLSFWVTNISLSNSDASEIQMNFRYLPFNPTNYSNPTAIIDQDLHSWSQEFAQYRITQNADLVVFLTQRAYQDNLRGAAKVYSGYNSSNITNPIWAAPCQSCYSAVVNINAIGTPFISGTHELGHLTGMRHNRPGANGWLNNGDPNGDCEHGWILGQNNYEFHTIMSIIAPPAFAINQNAHRVLHFSNPEVELNDEPTGDADEANNANFIKQTGCVVAAYTSSKLFQAWLEGEKTICLNPSSTEPVVINNPYLCAIALAGTYPNPGQTPFTYSWHWKSTPDFSPASPGQFVGNSDCLTLLPWSLSSFYIKVKITSADGLIWEQIQKIEIKYDCEADPQKPFTATSKFEFEGSLKRNKAESITINNSIVKIFNIQGKEVWTNNISGVGEIEQVTTNFVINTPNLPSGLYLIFVSPQNSNLTPYTIKIVRP